MRLLILFLPFVTSTLAICATQAGYCCNGSVVMKKHNNDFSADNFWCCEGDPNTVVNGDTGPTTCTAGHQIPLTDASKVGGSSGSATSSAAVGAGGAGSSSSSGNAAPLVTNAPLLGAAVAAGHLLLGV